MTPAQFDGFAAALAKQFARAFTGHQIFVAVFPPGAFDGQCGALSASTLPAAAQPAALRGIADSLERNASTQIFEVKL